MKKENKMPQALSLIEQKKKLDAANSNDEKAYTELFKQALKLNLEKPDMDHIINELLCHKIDFHFLKRNKRAEEILLSNIEFLERDYLSTIKDQIGKWPVDYENILYFKKYSDTDAYVKCVHWDECEGYWEIYGLYGDDFDYLYDRWDLRDFYDSSDAIDHIKEKVLNVDDLDNLNYYHDNYHWDEAWGQYVDFLDRYFVSFWKERRRKEWKESYEHNLEYAKKKLGDIDSDEFLALRIESLANSDEVTFQYFIDKIADQKSQIEKLENHLQTAENYIKVLQDSKG